MAQLSFDLSAADPISEPELGQAIQAEGADGVQADSASDVPTSSKRPDPIVNPLRFVQEQLEIDVFTLARLLKTSATHATDWLQRGCWPESPSARQHLTALANEHGWDLGHYTPPPEPMLPLF